MENPLVRYAKIEEKNPREIVLLRGTGCVWGKCRFCDYHLDSNANADQNYQDNRSPLSKISGCFGQLEVINSGSFFELDSRTRADILTICDQHTIDTLYIECHWLLREQAKAFRAICAQQGIRLVVKTGIETFDIDFRENILKKGIGGIDALELSAWFDECCLLQGLTGQTVDRMLKDIRIGLLHFNRVCINLMQENTASLKPNAIAVENFYKHIYPLFCAHPRVDLLLENTDFGVGGLVQ